MHLHWILSSLEKYIKHMQDLLYGRVNSWIKIAGRRISNLRHVNGATLMAENEELKSLLMRLKEESEKAGLKVNIQKTKGREAWRVAAQGVAKSWTQQLNGNT